MFSFARPLGCTPMLIFALVPAFSRPFLDPQLLGQMLDTCVDVAAVVAQETATPFASKLHLMTQRRRPVTPR
ncbi:hypothetical protein [Streptomyces sp. NPDC055134]